MYKEELYEGERVQAAPVVQPVQARDVMSEAVAKGMQQVARNMGELLMTGAQMEDAKNEFEAERELLWLQSNTRMDVERRLQLPDGHDEALFDKHGNLRETQVANMTNGIHKALEGIGQRIMNPESRLQMQAKAGLTGARILDDLAGTWQKVQHEKMVQAWQDSLALAKAQGDTGGMLKLYDRAAQVGIMSATKAQAEKLNVRKDGMRALGRASRGGRYAPRVKVGGQEYSGASAALAMAAARARAGRPAAMRALAPMAANGAPATGGGVPAAEVSAAETSVPVAEVGNGDTVVEAVAEPTPEMPDMLAVQPTIGLGATAVEDDDPLAMDASANLSVGDFERLMGDFTFGNTVYTLHDDLGRAHFDCPSYADDTVQRVAAQAEAKGELDVDACRGMVARITMQAVTENPEATTANVLEQFDDAGIYEVLGYGDADVGKVRARAVVDEFRQRSAAGTTKVNMATINRLVNDKVNGRDFGSGQEWKKMEALNPGLKKKNGEYKEWDDGKGKQRENWGKLFEVYKKYRSDFNPHAEGEADDDEFNENAGAFYEWYMDNMHKDMKKHAVDAAKDYYTAAILEKMQGSVGVDSAGAAMYTGYASEVALAQDVLKQEPGSDLGAAAVVQREQGILQEDRKRREAYMKLAKTDYQKLVELKGQHKAKSASAERAAAKKEAADKKAAEQAAAKKLYVARNRSRKMGWEWDNADSPYGEQPACTVPREEYRKLVDELGYDEDTHLVYLMVGGAKVFVVGPNDGQTIRLNSPAVMKIQKKPKKGEDWAVNGELGYYYQFRTASAK